MLRETKIRSVIKSISWRICATLTTVTLVVLYTGKVKIAFTIGFTEVFIKLFIYFMHERGWNKLKWGKKEVQPYVIWITGLVGSGKTSIAKEITNKLRNKGFKTEHLDGGTIRKLFPTTGFTKSEIIEHIKRVALLSNKLESMGVFVVTSFVSPYRESRSIVRNICKNYIEIYLSTPVEVCKKRDTKGIYKKAQKGKIKNLPGVDVKYEVPQNMDITIDTSDVTIDEASNKIIEYLHSKKIFN